MDRNGQILVVLKMQIGPILQLVKFYPPLFLNYILFLSGASFTMFTVVRGTRNCQFYVDEMMSFHLKIADLDELVLDFVKLVLVGSVALAHCVTHPSCLVQGS